MIKIMRCNILTNSLNDLVFHKLKINESFDCLVDGAKIVENSIRARNEIEVEGMMDPI